MNKQLLLSYLIAGILTPYSINAQPENCKKANSCDCDNTGKSYFSVRPQFQSASPELISAFREDRLHARKEGKGGALEAVVFGGKSTNNNNLARYFTPFCKTTLTVNEEVDPTIQSDLQAQHFNIVTVDGNFSSTLSFKPKQSVAALGLYYRQSFWCNPETNRDWFFSISSPITHIKNEFNLVEKVINNGGGANENADKNVVANMTQAFAQKEWKYGRITCPQTETRLADIETKLGMEWINNETHHLESYMGVLIPTGNRPNGENIFQPIVGNGKHAGIMCGGAGNFELWHNKDNNRQIKIECATHSLYLFNARQVRSLDLKNKPFSRYMEVYANKEQAAQAAATTDPLLAENMATPGINIFTLPVKVSAGFQYNVTTALTFTCNKCFQAEGGFNFFARQAECVKLACPWQPGPALKSILGKGETNPARDITGNVFLNSINIQQTDFADYDNNLIKEHDLDLNSAAHPAGLSYTFYGSVGYRCDEREYPLFAHIGGSYEFANESNATLDRWTLWAKTGISF
ncbi:MAG: hypothetical protein NT124_04690 [Candidatus Dependentiae bacterium]|nr:hypothetical protein [Candidatus Dependentiae bacterium]